MSVRRQSLGEWAWPWGRFAVLPDTGYAADIANRWRALATGSDGAVSTSALAAALGVEVHHERLEAAGGGIEAVLRPRAGGGWSATIDPDPTPAERLVHSADDPQAAHQRSRWRLAHELAHTCFYGTTAKPHHRRLRCNDQREERWCDLLAGALLNPFASLATPRSAQDLLAVAGRTLLPLPCLVAALQARGHDAGTLITSPDAVIAEYGRPALAPLQLPEAVTASSALALTVDGLHSWAALSPVAPSCDLADCSLRSASVPKGEAHAEVGVDERAAAAAALGA